MHVKCRSKGDDISDTMWATAAPSRRTSIAGAWAHEDMLDKLASKEVTAIRRASMKADRGQDDVLNVLLRPAFERVQSKAPFLASKVRSGVTRSTSNASSLGSNNESRRNSDSATLDYATLAEVARSNRGGTLHLADSGALQRDAVRDPSRTSSKQIPRMSATAIFALNDPGAASQSARVHEGIMENLSLYQLARVRHAPEERSRQAVAHKTWPRREFTQPAAHISGVRTEGVQVQNRRDSRASAPLMDTLRDLFSMPARRPASAPPAPAPAKKLRKALTRNEFVQYRRSAGDVVSQVRWYEDTGDWVDARVSRRTREEWWVMRTDRPEAEAGVSPPSALVSDEVWDEDLPRDVRALMDSWRKTQPAQARGDREGHRGDEPAQQGQGVGAQAGADGSALERPGSRSRIPEPEARRSQPAAPAPSSQPQKNNKFQMC
jgi:hypothetical protein